MSKKKKHAEYFDEHGNLIEGLTPLHKHYDTYIKACGRFALRDMKKEFIADRNKQKKIMLTSNPEKYIRVVLEPDYRIHKNMVKLDEEYVLISCDELASILKTLDHKEAVIISLTFFSNEKMSQGDMAEKLDMALQTLRNKKHIILEGMREELKKHGYKR